MEYIEKDKMKNKVFSIFIKEVLERRTIECDKEIKFDYAEYAEKNGRKILLEFDAIAEKGFEEIEGPVIFEFKPNGKLNQDVIKKIMERISNNERYVNATYIFVVNGNVNEKLLLELGDNFDSRRVRIWDAIEIEKWVKRYKIEYFNALNSNNESNTNRDINKLENSIYIDENSFVEKNNVHRDRLNAIVSMGEPLGIVLGAGVSIEQGAKSWNDLLSDMKLEVNKSGLSDNPDNLAAKVGGSSLTTAQLCRDVYNSEPDFLWKVHESLYPHKNFSIDRNSELASVARLSDRCKNLRHFRILTYNFDDYLERYLDNEYVQYSVLDSQKDEYFKGKSKTETYELNGIPSNDFCIYHVHGLLKQAPNKSSLRGTICLTEADYNLLYNQPYSWPIISQMSFFRENICLFVGCSLVDPNIRRLLELAKIENHWHYAIIQKDTLSNKDLAQATAHFCRLGVRIIWINSFSEIPGILDQIGN